MTTTQVSRAGLMLRGATAMIAAGAVGVLAISLFGCVPDAEVETRAEGEPANESFPDRYTVRGKIAMLPDDRSPLSELQIQHEYIPDFRGRDGAIHTNPNGMPGMLAMVMPFPIADGVSFDGYGVGDLVEFDFEVTWGMPPYELTRIRALPADTELDFGTMESPADETADDEQAESDPGSASDPG